MESTTLPVPVTTAEMSDLDRKIKQLMEALASNLIITNYKAKNLKAPLKVLESEMVSGLIQLGRKL